jgi:alpha-beta hydrolase superfamily lysophospholipase
MTVQPPATTVQPPASPSELERRVTGFLVKTFLYRGRRGGPWELPAHLTAHRVGFGGNSGARLVGYHFPCPDPAGIVVLAHPDKRYAKHWFVKEGWIDWLLGQGFECLIFDFPVYGESGGGSAHLGDDVAAAVRWAQHARPGLPVHVIGVSVGAFAAINGLRHVDRVAAVVLESPYPDFGAWYGKADGAKGWHRALNRAMERVFPKTYAYIHAGENVRHIVGDRILIAASKADSVTPIELSRMVAANAPPDRTEVLELDGAAHLDLFRTPQYRAAILRALRGPQTATPDPIDRRPRRTIGSVALRQP